MWRQQVIPYSEYYTTNARKKNKKKKKEKKKLTFQWLKSCSCIWKTRMNPTKHLTVPSIACGQLTLGGIKSRHDQVHCIRITRQHPPWNQTGDDGTELSLLDCGSEFWDRDGASKDSGGWDPVLAHQLPPGCGGEVSKKVVEVLHFSPVWSPVVSVLFIYYVRVGSDWFVRLESSIAFGVDSFTHPFNFIFCVVKFVRPVDGWSLFRFALLYEQCKAQCVWAPTYDI
jgi:hypothetical protein